LEVNRSSARYRSQPAGEEEEKRLVKRLHELKAERPRFGSPRMTALLRAEGWRVNHKRVERLMKREGLNVPRKQRKRRRLGTSDNAASRRRAERPGHVWSWDFTFDRTEDGRALKWFALVDEFTRECVTLEVGRGLTAERVKEEMNKAIARRGAPEHIRSDNGPEFIARALRAWLEEAQVGTLYIEPGAPWENPYIESFNGKLKDEFIKGELFTSLLEAQVLTREWRKDYNERRPHSALKYLAPAEFARRWDSGSSGRSPTAPTPHPNAPGFSLIRTGT
jgi:transposase InsO family protein